MSASILARDASMSAMSAEVGIFTDSERAMLDFLSYWLHYLFY
jgi:hypothetical protein